MTGDILAVVGLRKEARIIASPRIRPVVAGGDPDRRQAAVREALRRSCRGVLSVGLAGALDPQLEVGEAVIADQVWSGPRRFDADPAWRAALEAALPEAKVGPIAGAEAVLAEAADKRRLRRVSRALAVDMESLAAARAAEEAGLPFAALRVVSDGAEESLPRSATVGLGPDGQVEVLAVLASLLRRPWDLPPLLRTARGAGIGFRALGRVRGRLGPALGFPDV